MYKELPFTIENAEKFPKAELVITGPAGGKHKIWNLTRDGQAVFVNGYQNWIKHYLYGAEYLFSLRIHLTKVPLIYYRDGEELSQSGYFVNIDEQGNIVGEPFI